MMLKTVLVICTIFCLWSFRLQAQYYSSGNEPFSTSWCQITTGDFQIIFPKEYSDKAQVFAAKMDYAYQYVAKSMPGKSRKLSVIIHTQTANSNGLVAWAPRRMELWTTPSQGSFNYAHEWMEQLILHETRHFVQENKMNQGLGKVLGFILGEQGEMIPLGLKTRTWVMEGDAVATETALSHSGRGRLPEFEQGLRALTLEKGKQNYDIATLGSYYQYIPNYYEIGYHTIAVNRLERDSALFDHKMDRIGKYFFGRGIRDNHKIKYYGFAIDYLDSVWHEQDAKIVKTSHQSLLPDAKDYYSFLFLQEDEGNLYALRKSLSYLPQFVEINAEGQQRIVKERGYSSEYNFSVCHGKIVYTDIIRDPRWEQKSCSDLFVLDVKSGETKHLTHGEVLQAPSFSPDGNRICAVWTDGLGHYGLHLYDAYSGSLLGAIPNPTNQYYFSPTWSTDGQQLVYVGQEKDKKALKIFNLQTQKETVLVAGTYGELSHPVCADSLVYFTGSYSGINNIYKYNLNNGQSQRLTSARFGADYAAINKDKVFYSNYTSDGYRPVMHLLSQGAGEPLDQVEDMGLGLADRLTAQEGGAVDFSKTPDTTYQVDSYKRWSHLLNIHSWFPFYFVGDDDESSSTGPTNNYAYLQLMSQNKLSTMNVVATYDGKEANSRERYNLELNYTGFYPQLSLEFSAGDFVQQDQVSVPPYNGSSFAIRETKIRDVVLSPSISLPLQYTKGVYTTSFETQLSCDYVRYDVVNQDVTESYYSPGLSAVYSHSKQAAYRDLYTPMSLSLWSAVDYSKSYDYRWVSGMWFYLPGLWNHHSFQGGLVWQKKDILNANFSAMLPHGYTSHANKELVYGTGEYYLPFSYPDFHLWNIFNIKRCALGLYGDVASMVENDRTEQWFGAGGSLFFDVNFFRYEVDFRIGVQAGVAQYTADDDLQYPINFIFTYSVF